MNNLQENIQKLQKRLEGLPAVSLDLMEGGNTLLLIVDMIGGFARKGALYSPRTERMIPRVADFAKKCGDKGIQKVAFADCHPANSPEFSSYPPHCLEGTEESAVIGELSGYTLFPKNSTNAMFAPGFREYLLQNQDKMYYLITGVCTDICVYQLALGLKCWFNQKNLQREVIVPISMVDTFDLGQHDANLYNLMFLNSMLDNGIKVVKDIL